MRSGAETSVNDTASSQTDPRFVPTERVWIWFLSKLTQLRGVKIPGWVWVVLIWALMAFPAASLRGTHFEEGTVIGLARGALDDGHWLTPHRYGIRFTERPVLLSWIIALLGMPLGGISVLTARLPHLLFLLGGGLMVFNLVRNQTRDAPAVFGACCWFACPMIAQKFVTAEPDVTMSVLMFAAFVMWWKGEARRNISLRRWIAIGFVLAAAGLTKGPQPLAYFSLGVGTYILVKQRWNDVAGFVGAHLVAGLIVASWYGLVMHADDIDNWKRHSRLGEHMSPAQWTRDHLDFLVSIVVEWLPGSLLIVPAAIALARKKLTHDQDLVLALLLYALVCSLALVLWPGGIATRYAMPANLALAVLCGLLFDRWWSEKTWLIAAVNTIAITISTSVVILGWIVMPLRPQAFSQTAIAGQTIAAVRTLVPGPVYFSNAAANMNIMAYVEAPVREMTTAEFEHLTRPALAIVTQEEIALLTASSPQLKIISHAQLKDKIASIVVEIRPN